MQCPVCRCNYENWDYSLPFVICEKCLSVSQICNNLDIPHAIPFNVNYCPICGNIVSSESGIKTAAFLSYDSIQCTSQKTWSGPVSLGFRNCNNVFSVSFDQFLIFINEKGQYKIFLNKICIKEQAFRFINNEVIRKLVYSSHRILFLTSNKNLYNIKINTLFAGSEPEKIDDRVDSFDYDIHYDFLAYSKGNNVRFVNCQFAYKDFQDDGRLTNIVLAKEYIFYTKIQKDTASLIVKSLVDARQSSKTLRAFKKHDGVFAASSYEYIIIILSNGKSNKLYAGKWKNLAMNANSWDETETKGSVTTTLMGPDALVFLKYIDRIEIKDINSISSGIRNQRFEIPDLLPCSIYLSANMMHISYCIQENDTSQVFQLSKQGQVLISSVKASFLIHNYNWSNGHLICTFKLNGSFHYSTEEIKYED